MREHLDLGSRIVIVVTLALFVAALFVKGFSHELLLEAGVFLVSVKLIIMAYKSSISARELKQRLDSLEASLARIESRFERATRNV